MRKDVYDMFSVYGSDFQYRWNRIIASGFEAFARELARVAGIFGLRQHEEGGDVLWVAESGEVEAMFAYVIDPKDLERIMATYKRIKDRRIPLTFVIIEQRGDGEGQYDIFRISETSYLEHVNRAYVEGTSCDD